MTVQAKALAWWEKQDTVLSLARWLVASGFTAEELLRYFEKPYCYEQERRIFLAQHRPEVQVVCAYCNDVRKIPGRALDYSGDVYAPCGTCQEWVLWKLLDTEE